MEGIVQEQLEKVKEYLISIENDYETDSWVIKVGLPAKWVVNNNDLINISIITEMNEGKIISIRPISPNITIDVLLEFISLIIKTNQAIIDRQKEFALEVKKMEEEIAEKTKGYFNEINKLGASQAEILSDTTNLTKESSTGKTKKIKKLPIENIDENLMNDEQ